MCDRTCACAPLARRGLAGAAKAVRRMSYAVEVDIFAVFDVGGGWVVRVACAWADISEGLDVLRV